MKDLAEKICHELYGGDMTKRWNEYHNSTINKIEAILTGHFKHSAKSRHIVAINSTLDEMVGIGGVPTDREWYDEFTFRLAKYVGTDVLKPSADMEERAREYLGSHWKNSQMDDYCLTLTPNEYIKDIAQFAQLYGGQQWISVEDRLPEIKDLPFVTEDLDGLFEVWDVGDILAEFGLDELTEFERLDYVRWMPLVPKIK